MYKLLKSELKIIDKFWEFIEIFRVEQNNTKKSILNNNVQHYRKKLIKKIRDKYTIDDFYKYEIILNKLLWNLIKLINFDINNLTINSRTYFKLDKRSYSHKKYLHNEINNQKYFFAFYEDLGDYEIVNKLFCTLSNKNLYEKVIKNKKYFDEINCQTYYYPFDYPFPNINLLFYNKNKKETWINNIHNMYYKNITSNNINNNGWYNYIF